MASRFFKQTHWLHTQLAKFLEKPSFLFEIGKDCHCLEQDEKVEIKAICSSLGWNIENIDGL